MTGFGSLMQPVRLAESDKLRAALNGYAAADIGTMLEALSPGAGANRRKAERIEVLLRLLSDPAVARRAIGLLTPLGRRLLGIARRTGQTTIAALLLAGQDASRDEARVKAEIGTLLARALLVAEPPVSGATKVNLDLSAQSAILLRLWVPQVMLDALPALGDDLPPLAALRDEPAGIEAGSFALLRRDLYLALRYLKAGGLRLTRTGDPHRSDLRKLLASLQPGKAPARRDADTAQVEGRGLFLLRLLNAAGLVVATGSELIADESAEEFLNRSEIEAARQLFDAWLDMDWNEFSRLPNLVIEHWSYAGAGDVPDLPQMATARRAIVALLATMASRWVGVHALADRLRQTDPEFLIARVPEYPPSHYSYYGYYGYDTYYGTRQALEQLYYRGIARADPRSRDRRLRKDQDWHDVEGALIALVLGESLRWLGLVDAGYDRSGPHGDVDPPRAVRLTDLGRRLLGGEAVEEPATRRGVGLVVQPNFEVLVLDALANLDLISRLDAFAEVQSLDRAAVYRLTRAALVRGLAAGWTEERIVAALEEAAAAPLPQNVRHTLADWAREYERVHLHREATILEAPDAAALDAWLADPALAPALVRRLTPTVALVRAGAMAQLATTLEGRGVPIGAMNYALDPPQVFDLRGPGTILVHPEDDDPYLRYRLVRFADREEASDGRFVAYSLSPASLQRARQGGMAIDEILSFIGYKARTALSPDDVLTLRGWSGYYAPFQWAKVRAVELPPTANWGDLSRVKALRPLILRILTASLALIGEEDWPKLEAALAARGIALEPGLGVQPQAEKRSAAQRAAATLGIATGRDLVAGNVVELHPTGPAKPAPTQRLTGRALLDLIESALDNEQALVIEYQKQGDRRAAIRTIEPQELEVRGGSYYLHAFCRTRQEDRIFRVGNILSVGIADE